MNITTLDNPTAEELDALEASRPRLVRQTKPGTYVVVRGPIDPAAVAAQHERLAGLYRERLALARAEGDRDTVAKIELLPEVHERRAAEARDNCGATYCDGLVCGLRRGHAGGHAKQGVGWDKSGRQVWL